MNVKKFLDTYKLQNINIDFKNEYQRNCLRVEFSFKTTDGTLQKNVFRYKTDPKDKKRFLFQVLPFVVQTLLTKIFNDALQNYFTVIVRDVTV